MDVLWVIEVTVAVATLAGFLARPFKKWKI
jgi:hypothetical protein